MPQSPLPFEYGRKAGVIVRGWFANFLVLCALWLGHWQQSLIGWLAKGNVHDGCRVVMLWMRDYLARRGFIQRCGLYVKGKRKRVGQLKIGAKPKCLED
jgi:hypothetical protein